MFLKHQMTFYPMLPLPAFNRNYFTTVKTNMYPHSHKQIWKRVLKNCEDRSHILLGSNMHFKKQELILEIILKFGRVH